MFLEYVHVEHFRWLLTILANPTIFFYFRIPIAILIVISLVGSSLGSLQSSTRNHDLLTKIGLKRVRAPQSHHSKRLAVQSRHRSRSDDSHMFIIKLPPNPHYYGFTNPNSIHEPIKKKSIPIGFKSNGKPAKIYHWNLPVLKSIAAHKLKSRKNDIHDITINDFPNPESWNEVLDKPEKDNYKPRKPSYYVPAKPKKSQFTNNLTRFFRNLIKKYVSTFSRRYNSRKYNRGFSTSFLKVPLNLPLLKQFIKVESLRDFKNKCFMEYLQLKTSNIGSPLIKYSDILRISTDKMVTYMQDGNFLRSLMNIDTGKYEIFGYHLENNLRKAFKQYNDMAKGYNFLQDLLPVFDYEYIDDMEDDLYDEGMYAVEL
ncbi:hypothetical protein WA026_001274 [Henosepilachna vigintioctopunctata]|uniref:Uncharacterized protein n=1 Tax=Henosepilachna vigintioctopunctata TaxID=420089 RepID=A0AAW1UJ60_9CUCU